MDTKSSLLDNIFTKYATHSKRLGLLTELYLYEHLSNISGEQDLIISTLSNKIQITKILHTW